MFMKEPEPLDTLLREWKAPEPAPELDRRVTSAFRSEARPPDRWRRFWRLRISVPVPVLLAAALAVFALFFWLRPAAAPAASPETSGVVTRLNASGFQPLPNGEARVVPVAEVPR
jgi:hypothetical protein